MKNFYKRSMLIIMFLLAMALLVMLAMGQAKAATPSTPTLLYQQEISGTVTTLGGEPLLGVTVRVATKNYGTTTNLEGNYSIRANPGDMLVFSFIGFKTQEIRVSNQSMLNISLEEDVDALEEVTINAGYYNTTRRESTGNISRVTAEEIENQPVVSPIQALQGRMAGVEVTPGGNLPGQAATIRIRGRNSLRDEGNFPLYIIDGVPINSTPIESFSNLGNVGIDPLNTLNLSNIESIEVLKDADATAIYGSRGANGVVLITTKKGRQGKTEIQARIYKGISTVPNRLELLKTEDYLQIRRRALENDGVEADEANAYDLVVWDQNRYTDWQEEFFGGSSQVTDINLNASGGNENTTYSLSGSYHKQGTIFLGDFDYNKVAAGLQLNHTSNNKKLNFNLSVNYGVDSNNLVGYLDLSSFAFYLPPNAPSLFNDDQSINWNDWAEVGLDNPLAGFYNSSKTQSNNLISNLVITYQLLKGLEFKTNFGYTYFNSNEIVKRPRRSYNPATWDRIQHRSNHLITDRKSWITEPQLIYSSKIGKGTIDGLVGVTIQESTQNGLSLYGEGYVSESLIGSLSAAENIDSQTNQQSEYKYAALFARLGFNWDKKYYINLTGRRDGSSRFGPGNRFANFGAVGGAWIFSEETFIRDHVSFLSFGKLRGSYGTTGSDQIANYGFLDAYEPTLGAGGLYPTLLANPDYSWEVNKKIEAAVELGFIEDRINIGLSWYRNRSSNQLVGYPLPEITGFTNVQANLPATVQNTGWEIELSTFNFQSPKFSWQTSLNLSFPKNELVRYPNLEQSSYANIYRVGHPLNIALLYNYEGLDPETGFYSVEDVNGDGNLNFEDRTIIRNSGREFFGGLNNNLNYKNFSLQFLWEIVKQNGRLALFNAGELRNQRTDVIRALDENSGYQQISASSQAIIAYDNVLNSTFSRTDASFIRLKTISLAYSLPNTFLNSLGLNSGKLFLNGQNLFTITPYEGIDPEAPNLGTSFPSLKTISFGIQLNF
ncbi:SusC/RagA family TonB-linked outer membrane protein [Christiangramia sp. SM2212]|uniref:SusC/RagA family TonB-linked outer membrane protein n=1 Tax=Christiangramia sediminicola TaxID=3073267 RepID=A0ABU1ERY3_9FLAO|nr:SusC/RagA family TonB-linked outer membrane protein [Christiangramia sp. SM2212]MDR5591139.1 SusC/RagA family TonB-linked outer membrane protein [Christiangramia sp. SM2212]